MLLEKITIKTVPPLPFSLIMVNYPIFSLNDHILCFQGIVQNYLFPKKIPKFFIKKDQHSAMFVMEVLIETTVSDF